MVDLVVKLSLTIHKTNIVKSDVRPDLWRLEENTTKKTIRAPEIKTKPIVVCAYMHRTTCEIYRNVSSFGLD
jgi:hypothetical protein